MNNSKINALPVFFLMMIKYPLVQTIIHTFIVGSFFIAAVCLWDKLVPSKKLSLFRWKLIHTLAFIASIAIIAFWMSGTWSPLIENLAGYVAVILGLEVYAGWDDE